MGFFGFFKFPNWDWVFLGFFGIGFFWDFLGFFWDFWVFLGFLNFQIGIGFFWVFLGLGFFGFFWDFLGFFGFFKNPTHDFSLDYKIPNWRWFFLPHLQPYFWILAFFDTATRQGMQR